MSDTRRKPAPSAKLEPFTENDLFALIAERTQASARQPGEHTIDELAQRFQMGHERMRNLLDKLESEGKVKKRKAGRFVYVRLVA